MSNSFQLHGTLDLPDSSVCGIVQARILEWVAIYYSRGSSWLSDQTWISCIAGELLSFFFFRRILYCLCNQGSPVNTYAAKSLQSCPTLCDPIDSSPPGCPVPGILQARTLEWVAISFSNAWKWKVKVKSLSCVQLLATPWTAAYPGSSADGIFQARVLEWGAIA